MSTAPHTLAGVARAINSGSDPAEVLTSYHRQRPDKLLASDYAGLARAVALAEEHGRTNLVEPLRKHLTIVAAEQAQRQQTASFQP